MLIILKTYKEVPTNLIDSISKIYIALSVENFLESLSRPMMEEYLSLKKTRDENSIEEFLRKLVFGLLLNIKSQLESRASKSAVYQTLAQLTGVCEAMTEIKMRLRILAIISKIFKAFGDPQFCLRYLRQYRNLSHCYNLFNEEMRA